MTGPMQDPTTTDRVTRAMLAPPPATRRWIAWNLSMGVLGLAASVLLLFAHLHSWAFWGNLVVGPLSLAYGIFLWRKRARTLRELAEAVAFLESWEKGQPS